MGEQEGDEKQSGKINHRRCRTYFHQDVGNAANVVLPWNFFPCIWLLLEFRLLTSLKSTHLLILSSTMQSYLQSLFQILVSKPFNSVSQNTVLSIYIHTYTYTLKHIYVSIYVYMYTLYIYTHPPTEFMFHFNWISATQTLPTYL